MAPHTGRGRLARYGDSAKLVFMHALAKPRTLNPGQHSGDPSTQKIPTLGPKDCKHYLLWAIEILRDRAAGCFNNFLFALRYTLYEITFAGNWPTMARPESWWQMASGFRV